MALFFTEAVLEVTMGGLEGRARDTGLAAGTHSEEEEEEEEEGQLTYSSLTSLESCFLLYTQDTFLILTLGGFLLQVFRFRLTPDIKCFICALYLS